MVGVTGSSPVSPTTPLLHPLISELGRDGHIPASRPEIALKILIYENYLGKKISETNPLDGNSRWVDSMVRAADENHGPAAKMLVA